MAGHAGRARVTASGAQLIAIDGVNAKALKDAARSLAAANRRHTAGVSQWGASGIFDEIECAEPDAGTPSPRTLLLLYAADLAFRIRWEIRPALDEGRMVIAAPYVSTAIALGMAAGLEAAWLADLFTFAPAAAGHHLVDASPAALVADRKGFVEFAWQRLEQRLGGLTRLQLMDRTRRHLRATASQKAGRGQKG
jgi:thymidylate kinase